MPILDWFNKKEALTTADNTPYKVLVENKDLSYGDQTQGNMLIKGDNLEALKALLPYYKGRVKCIYIDPPYNTGSAFEHYDDNLEHSTWLSLMYPRLELLRELLAEDGSIWVSLDDNELAYFKVLCDEIFHRDNYINMVTVKAKNSSGASGGGEDKRLKKNTEFLLVYGKSADMPPFKTQYEEIELSQYIENASSFAYTSVLTNPGKLEYFTSTVDGKNEEIKIYKRTGYEIKSVSELAKEEKISEIEVYYKYLDKIFTLENAQTSIRQRVKDATDEDDTFYTIEYVPVSGRNKGKKTEVSFIGKTKRLVSYLKYTCVTRKNKIYKKIKIGTLWSDLSWSAVSYEGDVSFPKGKKPEKLIARILDMASNEGDIIMDSFLGSGTTAAVAQKMGRKYIGIEMGEHAITHCVPRLKQVTDGTDQSGISKSVNWTGGNGFTFYNLGKSIFDEEGNINHGISFKDLAFHVWFSETKTPMQDYKYSPLLGVYQDTAYYLLYNGVLGDKRVNGGNVLTSKILESLPPFDGPKVIYGESCRLSPERLKKENIIFKQTPYEITAR